MYLLIDAGNSRIKWLYGNAVPGIVEAASYKEDWRTKLWRAWHLLPEPRRIAISCVNNASIETEVTAIVDDLWGKPLQTFIAQKETNHAHPVAYEDATLLGSDRYLAMLGARGLTHEPLCVVGCGTAITLDVVERDGQHIGGLILPGIRLAENALLQNTQKLRPMRWTPNLLGTDTAACIGAGIHHAIPAGINSIMDELETTTGHYYHRFAFGGDAQILFGNRPDYRIEPDLMFRGMIDRLATD